MNTTTAAATAGVTVATIRHWCRMGAVAATKAAGRWVIDTASLAHRITIGAMRARKAKTVDLTPLSRGEFEKAAAALGIRAPFGDPRCYGEYTAYQATGEPYSDTPYQWLLIRRGVALAAEGYTPPARRRRPHDCLTCGLDDRTCDCI